MLERCSELLHSLLEGCSIHTSQFVGFDFLYHEGHDHTIGNFTCNRSLLCRKVHIVGHKYALGLGSSSK
jgi:hypothetical protein